MSSNNYLAKWNAALTTLVEAAVVESGTNLAVLVDLAVASNAAIGGRLSVGTNQLWVMGTNIITNWPHTSLVTNLNADMVDGKHASELGGITKEVDPQVADNMTQNSVPRWDVANTQLVTGNIFDNGNIGIGTAGPGYKLTVAGGDVWASGDIYLGTRGIWLSQWLDQALRTSASPIFGNLELRMNNADVKLLFLDQANYWYSMGIDYSDGSKLKINRGGNIGDYNDLTIDHTGNLGIGTTSPGAKLDVVGSIWANGSRPIKLNPAGSITIQAGPGGWADYLHFLGSSGTDRGGFGAAGSDDNLTYLYAGDSYSNPTMVWKGGKVGIGTDVNPSSRLHIRQSLNDRDGGLYIQRAGTDYGAVMYVDPGGSVRIGTRSDPGAEYDTDYIYLRTGTGKVGIGTPVPDAKLDVLGDARISGPLYLNFSDNRIEANWYEPHPYLALTAADYYTVLKPSYYGFRITNFQNQPPNNLELKDDGHLWIKGSYHSISDSRMKANQEPLDYGLAEVLELKPMRFVWVNWTMDPETGEIVIEEPTATRDFGLIAQDVYKVMPEAVSKPEDESTGYWGLVYDKLIAVMAKAIQEQQQSIQTLQSQIQSQQSQIDELKNEIQAIKSGK